MINAKFRIIKMRRIIVLTFILAIYSFAQAQQMSISKKENAQNVQPTTYTCLMHPEIYANKPGNCTKCGMPLVKEKTKVIKKVVKKAQSMKMPSKKISEKESVVDDMKIHNEEVHKGHNMSNTDWPKTNLDPIKTVVAEGLKNSSL